MPYFEISVKGHLIDDHECIFLDTLCGVSSAVDKTVADFEISFRNIGLGTAKNISYIFHNIDGTSYPRDDLHFSSITPGDYKKECFDICMEEKPADNIHISLEFCYLDLLENKYAQVIDLFFSVKPNGHVEIHSRENSPTLISRHNDSFNGVK